MNLVYIFMGLILGIVGNLLVSFYMQMLQTDYSDRWVWSFLGSLIVLLLFSAFWLRYARGLIKSVAPKQTAEKPTKTRPVISKEELEALLSIYNARLTIISLFAGFILVTIPVILFYVEPPSEIIQKLCVFFLLASFDCFFLRVILRHSWTMRLLKEIYPNIPLKEGWYSGYLMTSAVFFMMASIGFMLLLKAWVAEAIIWFSISIVFALFSHTRVMKAKRA